jgi:hypothetical protein
MAVDTGISIIHGAETMLLTNQTPPEIDAPPLPSPQLPPIAIIDVANGNTNPPNVNNSPLTPPTMTTATRGSDVTETTNTGENSQETAARQLVSIQNIAFEYNEAGVALSVPQTTAQLQFNAKDSYHDGYDSDSELGPFFDAIMDEASDSEDDEELPTAAGVESASTLQLPTDVPPLPPPPLLTEDAVKRMNVAQLKDELKKQKLTVNGVKLALQERLLGNSNSNSNCNNLPSATPAVQAHKNVTCAGFAEAAVWRELKTIDETVKEANQYPNLVGPTVPAGEREYPKHNFAETFDCLPFTTMSPVIEIGRNGEPVKNRRGEVQWTNKIREKGRANKTWVDEHGLTEFSKPSDWFEVPLPLKKNKDGPRSMVLISDWTSYLNTHAILSNAGHKNHIYPDFTPFSPQEVKQFIGLYILQGLSPSPEVRQKFKPHHEDFVNGNDLCYQVFGKKGREATQAF